MKIDLSPLDSARFGVRSARAADLTAADLPQALDFCRQERIVFLIGRCAAEDFAAVHALEENGFRLMDTLVWYERRLDDAPQRPDPDIRPAREADAPALRQLAAAAFHGYRGHYHADPRLDPAACDALYVDWAVRSLQPPVAEAVLVHPAASGLDGFVTLKVRSPETVELPLYGVHPQAQGQGLGKRLVQAALLWARRRGAARLVTSTQVVNLRSQRVWLGSGFRPFHVEYTFHRWFEENAA